MAANPESSVERGAAVPAPRCREPLLDDYGEDELTHEELGYDPDNPPPVGPPDRLDVLVDSLRDVGTEPG